MDIRYVARGGGGWMLRDQRIRLLNGSNQRILIEDGILLNVNTTHTRERVRVKVSDGIKGERW